MAKDKQLIIQNINSFLSDFETSGNEFDPEDITFAMLAQCPTAVKDWLDSNTTKLLNSLIKQHLKRVAGTDYSEETETQVAFDFDIPKYLSVRDGNGKAKYIKSDDAHHGHFSLAGKERQKQADYDSKQARKFFEIADILESMPTVSLRDALRLLKEA